MKKWITISLGSGTFGLAVNRGTAENPDLLLVCYSRKPGEMQFLADSLNAH